MQHDPGYTIGRFRNKLALVYSDTSGRRHRHTLGTSDPGEAQRLAPTLYAELIKPRGTTVADLWGAYRADKAGRRIAVNMVATGKALLPRFGEKPATAVSVQDCRAYITARRLAGRKDWTVYGELGHLRMVLVWAEKQGFIQKAPYIERPPQPPPKADYFTRDQIVALIKAATTPHVRLFIILAIGTGARRQALFELTWDRVDFSRRLIELKNPKLTAPHKGRALVPMNDMVQKALEEAKKAALSEYVVEYAGKPVASVKRGLTSCGNRVGLKNVTAHMFRHSAAVHMAEDSVPMEEIAQFLGHSDVNVTRKVYARFSPTHLRRAAASLEYDV